MLYVAPLCAGVSMWRVSVAMCLWYYWGIAYNLGLGIGGARIYVYSDYPYIGHIGILEFA